MPTKRIAVYPGSFDPIHAGHIAILKQALEVFDQVIILVADNPGKTYQCPHGIRTNLIHEYLNTGDLAGCNGNECIVRCTSKPLAEFCRDNSINFVVRGLRNGTDLDYEESQQYFVTKMLPELTYTFFTVPPIYREISSSSLRQFAKLSTLTEFYQAYWPGERACEGLAGHIHQIYRKKK